MGNLSIDFDDLARDMGETLDMCEYAVKAAKSPESEFDRKPNFSKALLSCVGVQAVSDFVLDNLQVSDIHNRDRFTALRNDAIKLTKRFWANFSLDNVNWQDAPEPTDRSNGHEKHGTRGPRITEDERNDIETFILEKYNGTLTTTQMQAVAEHFKRSVSAIQRIYYNK